MATTAAEPQAEKKDKRPSTAHLKVVPETRELRDRVRAEAARFGRTLDRSKPFTKRQCAVPEIDSISVKTCGRSSGSFKSAERARPARTTSNLKGTIEAPPLLTMM